MRIGINGFGRIGRLVFRALWGRPGIELVHVNEPGGDGASCGHLLAFDSVHGRWQHEVSGDADGFRVGDERVSCSRFTDPTAVPWQAAGVELVLECSGRFKTPDTLNPYFEQCGLKRVVMAPWRMPKLSCTTFTTGARQLVVQEAAVSSRCRCGS